MTTEQWFSLSEAAKRVGKSKSQMQRYAIAGRIVGAERLGNVWRLPYSGLVMAGLTVSDEPGEAPKAEADRLRAEIEKAQADADRLRSEIASLHRVIAAKDEHLEDLRKIAFGQIGPGSSSSSSVDSPPVATPGEPIPLPAAPADATPVADPVPPSNEETPRRRWWQR